jgi:hypothetical protein
MGTAAASTLSDSAASTAAAAAVMAGSSKWGAVAPAATLTAHSCCLYLLVQLRRYSDLQPVDSIVLSEQSLMLIEDFSLRLHACYHANCKANTNIHHLIYIRLRLQGAGCESCPQPAVNFANWKSPLSTMEAQKARTRTSERIAALLLLHGDGSLSSTCKQRACCVWRM